MHENEISGTICQCAIEVHKYFGPGLLESVYQRALALELIQKGLDVRQEVGIPVRYRGVELGLGFRMDLLVSDKVVVELKSVEVLHPVHYKQLLSYLKLTKFRLGLLINFNDVILYPNIKRIVNNL